MAETDHFEPRTDGYELPFGVSGRALEILECLIEADGRVVTKDEIMRRLWPGSVVAENNLHVHISTLRKVMGPYGSLIKTVSGRGYRLPGGRDAVLNCGVTDAAESERAQTALQLPCLVAGLIGRDAAVAEVKSLVTSNRMVTLTGAGGIGKTRLALEAARQLASDFEGVVALAELAPLSDRGNVSRTVATALGLQFAGGSVSPEGVALALGKGHALLVIDNCEHLVDAVAGLVETLLRSCPALHVLATSREPLWITGEVLWQVPPLSLPKTCDGSLDLRGHGALELLLTRTQAMAPQFRLDPRTTAAAVAICRRLDGIPLAIELAAPRVATLGVDAVTAGLDDRFSLLTAGQRMALPQHQTLRATMDWSYELLSVTERAVLRRLAVFAGGFTLEAAKAVASGPDLDPIEVMDAITALVTKSQVSFNDTALPPRYLLLETTWAYAAEKLKQSEEWTQAARNHAGYLASLLERTLFEHRRNPSPDHLDVLRRELDNVRAAFDWAFGQDGGDPAIGVALAASSATFMFELSLVDECRRRIGQALTAAARLSELDAQREMLLHASLGTAITYTRGPTPESNAAWKRLLELSTAAGDHFFHARALWGLWTASIYGGRPRMAANLAGQFHQLATAQPNFADPLMGLRMIGVSQHFLGEQPRSRQSLERVVNSYDHARGRVNTTGYRVDQSLVASAVLARVLWLQGFSDQALALSEEAVTAAKLDDHVMSRCYVLVEAGVPIALATGDVDAAERHAATLLHDSTRHGLLVWQAWAHCYDARIAIERGNAVAGVTMLRQALNELQDTGFTAHYTCFLTVLADGLRIIGEFAEGLLAIDAAIARCTLNEEGWCMPEALRVKGDFLASDSQSARAAEAMYLEAISIARGQNALAWELRATTSLAGMLQRVGRDAQARAALHGVLERVFEGFNAKDYLVARNLLAQLPWPRAVPSEIFRSFPRTFQAYPCVTDGNSWRQHELVRRRPIRSDQEAVMTDLHCPIPSVHHRTAVVSGLEIFYREAGDPSAPAILLLHGFPSSSHMFRNVIPALADRYHVVAPDLPGFGLSAMPPRDKFDYTFENFARIVDGLTILLGLKSYALYVMDYGAPTGFRLALLRPERITALVTQNGNAYDEGLSPFWDDLKAYWTNPSSMNREALHPLLSLDSTRSQYLDGVRDVTRIDPSTWIYDQVFLDRPGNADIQLDLFYDYRTNVEIYSRFQSYFRQMQPPTLVAWGANDDIFSPAGAKAFKRDLPSAEIHLLDSGHFALEDKLDEIVRLLRDFLGRVLKEKQAATQRHASQY